MTADFIWVRFWQALLGTAAKTSTPIFPLENQFHFGQIHIKMFQTLLRRAFACNTSNAVPIKFVRFNSTFQNRQRPKGNLRLNSLPNAHICLKLIHKSYFISEVFDVKIIGTLYQEPLTLKNGNKVITIRTFQPDGH